MKIQSKHQINSDMISEINDPSVIEQFIKLQLRNSLIKEIQGIIPVEARTIPYNEVYPNTSDIIEYKSVMHIYTEEQFNDIIENIKMIKSLIHSINDNNIKYNLTIIINDLIKILTNG
jgi:uncharacterized membrane protein